MFPTEVWEKILVHVDAASLVRLRTVSTTWNAIIAKHLRESCAWYKLCKSTIPEKYWLILLENSLHSTKLHRQASIHDEEGKFDNDIWITLYRAWIKWQNVEHFKKCTVHEFHPIPKHRPTERITCCTVLGELAAIGTSEGHLQVFNLRTNHLVFRCDQCEQVCDVKLCIQGKNNRKIILIATLLYNKSVVWNITDQKQLLKRSGDTICSGHGYYCSSLQHDKILVQNAVTGSCAPVRLFVKNFINAKNVKYSSMVITSDHHLCVLSNNGYYCIMDLEEALHSAHSTLYMPDVKYIGTPKLGHVRQYCLFNPFVAFCTTENGYLGVSVHCSKWRMYNVFPFFFSAVTAIFFHVRVLVLGLDCGDVHIFFVENEMELKNLDLKSEKSRKIHVASEPIVAVNITEVSGEQKLLVATKSFLSHIELDYGPS
ncbi:hypothetical protein QAD02_012016 [Eretmocerus hayati]|uniref:Uncharacterized protein n=1 Tax=Eretmocerus hayati TaxID=131215 RepID=A0ACC2P375_9HYME|nr:hypothetical protein QAD02_012016 [Eretmocerus hayati]